MYSSSSGSLESAGKNSICHPCFFWLPTAVVWCASLYLSKPASHRFLPAVLSSNFCVFLLPLASVWQWIELQVFSCHHLWFGALKLPETRLNWVFLRQLSIHQLHYLSGLINLSAWFWHEGLEGRIWEMWNDSALVVVRKELFGGSRMAFAKS